MTDDLWRPAQDALDAAGAAGRHIDVWLRDADCVSVTPALERLTSLCDRVGLPILLAVIPLPAEQALASWLRVHPHVTPCQHGFAHANHAAHDERARELGGRPVSIVLKDLAQGRARLQQLFGAALSDVLVPPWNRIDGDVIPHLPGLGYSALSCFAPTPEASPIQRLDSDLDIIDWRGGRIGRPLDDLARKLAGIVDRQDRLGILTHHLAHDAAAWDALSDVVERLASHPAVHFATAASLLA